MNAMELLKAVGNVGDDLIAGADIPKKKKTGVTVLRFTALAACAALALTAALRLGIGSRKSTAGDAAMQESTAVTNTVTFDTKSEPSAVKPAAEAGANGNAAPKAAKEKEAPAEAEETAELAKCEEEPVLPQLEFEGRIYELLPDAENPPEPGAHLGTLADGREVYACEEGLLWIKDAEGLWLYRLAE